MIRRIINAIYLCWWERPRRVGQSPKIKLECSHETYGRNVTDLTWKLRLGKYKRTLSERVTDYNMISVIRHVEREELPLEIEKMKASSNHPHTSSEPVTED